MLIRSGTAEDAEAITEVFVRARERMKYLPDLHTREETRAFLRKVVQEGEVWVVEQDERVIGFAALRDNLLEHLYVHPMAQRFGVGSSLLERAKTRRPTGLKAWVFQKNKDARRFYEARGFELVELTEGAANEEQEPDALYEWRGRSAS
ncbi:MAG TPA: GNAT family N-acetyltransferase [Polyangiaceae bacterium]